MKKEKPKRSWLLRGRIAEWGIILAGVPVQPFNMLGIAGTASMLEKVSAGAETIKAYILITWLITVTLGGWWVCVWKCRRESRPNSVYWALGSLVCAHGMILTALGFGIWGKVHG